MNTASRSWSLYFGDFIRSLGHVHTREDLDVQIKKKDDQPIRIVGELSDEVNQNTCGKSHGDVQCSYILTYVDDFLIIDSNLELIMDKFKEQLNIRNVELNPSSYLGFQ